MLKNDVLKKFEGIIYNRCIITETRKFLQKEELECIQNYKKKLDVSFDFMKEFLKKNEKNYYLIQN